MTIGRPCKYHTEDEQREAHRLRNKKHYHKNKLKISDKRCSLREAKQTATDPSKNSKHRIGARRGTPLALARALFKQCQEKISIIKGTQSLLEILTEVCVEVQDHSGGDPAVIAEIVEAHQDVLRKLGVSSDLHRCHHEILNLVGCGKELNEIGKMVQEVNNLERGLDTIYAEGCLDYQGFLAEFERGHLNFQH